MSKRAEEAQASAILPESIISYAKEHAVLSGLVYREGVKFGYEQAEKDLAPAFEFSFDVPDNDGFIVFTQMDNQTIRRKLKLKKGERVIVSIKKEHEKE